jgi:hypothetical protein
MRGSERQCEGIFELISRFSLVDTQLLYSTNVGEMRMSRWECKWRRAPPMTSCRLEVTSPVLLQNSARRIPEEHVRSLLYTYIFTF